MEIKIKDAAALTGGILFGNGEDYFTGVAKLEEATNNDITFLYLPQYEKYFETTKAKVILVKPDFERKRDDINYIVVQNPNIALNLVINTFFKPEFNLLGVDKTAYLDTSVVLGQNVALGKNVVIGKGCKIGNNAKVYHNTVIMDNVTIGENCLIFPNVTIREDSVIGNRVIIHSGTVIGSDGFGYAPDSEGVYHKIPQIGNVVIEDDVELGSNVSIDRAAFGSTRIKKGCKIDNLVQIAHNVVVGENTVMSSQTGIAGSTKIGKNCIFAGQVGIVGHSEIADNVIIGAQSGVSKSLTKSGTYFGSPAKEIKTTLKLESHIRNLPGYVDRIKNLENKLLELEKLLGDCNKKMENK
ncbi:MAG TPA: UDP-3-O-(3-hydroxymyristoyl)glucosamine N-acyltransferase [Melioribacteraceae bacterium]|nr:UDP-3-O-(3-hydroxymyristoyl)glucosamine N-acyltransferase [Melioribacteraceae bacterium]